MIIDILLYPLAFLVAISVLIGIHEFGHYWVARRLGVKVLRFSIGFGKPLWTWRSKDSDRVEYVVASIPLGGYVKMLDEREEEVAESELPRAFNRQPVAKRFAIVAAGPVLNLLFAVFAFWLMYMSGVPGLRSELGPLPAGSIAASAGLREGAEILSVDGSPVRTRQEVLEHILPKALLHEPALLEVQEAGMTRSYTLTFDSVRGDESVDELVELIGIDLYAYAAPPWIESVQADSPSAIAGLRANDLIIAVNGVATADWRDAIAIIRKYPNEPVIIAYQRDGVSQEVKVIPRAEQHEGKTVGRIGAKPRIPEIPQRLFVTVKYGPLESIPHAVNYAWNYVTVTFKVIGGMLQRTVSTDQLNGMFTIAEGARDAALAGITASLRFLGLVSLSLGILNLLPIPVLDGGHLFFYLIELIKGSPVPERIEAFALKVGLTLLIGLMLLAHYNDLVKYTARVFK